MKKWTFLLLISVAQPAFSQEEKADGFPFLPDLGGKRVESLLRPGNPVKGDDVKATPLPRPAPRFLEEPEGIVSPTKLTPPRPELPDRRVTRPLPSVEPTPLTDYRHPPEPPHAIVLPAGELTHWPSILVEKVPSLPILGLPKEDRASLADPTLETSLAVALKEFFIPRVGPTPFVPVTLPDPFELRETVELRMPPPEDEVPPLVRFPRIAAK